MPHDRERHSKSSEKLTLTFLKVAFNVGDINFYELQI